VTAVANGIPELAEIRIDKALLQEEDLEMVQDLVVAAANAALTKAREHVDAEIEKITGGLSIPGLG
jgi:DNA-binding protein YbaB